MSQSNSDLEAADAALEKQFYENGEQGFLEKPYSRYRFHNGFLAGLAHRDTNPSEREKALVEAAGLILQNWPEGRDGMDWAEPIPRGVRSLREALAAYDGGKNG